MSSNAVPRYSIEISEADKQRIEACRKDLSWQELSFGGKLKVLIFERVEALEAELAKDQGGKS